MPRVVMVLAALALALTACSEAREAAAPVFDSEREGVLTVAAALPAPGFWEGDDPATVDGGFEWALAGHLADRFGLRLEVLDVPFSQIAAGKFPGADLAIAQISITDERAELVDFSIDYYDTSAGVLAPTGETLTDLRTARQLRWAVVEGTTEEAFVETTLRPDEESLVVDDEIAAAAAVDEGRVDAALMDLPTALVLAKRDPSLATIGRFLDDQRYGVALPRSSPNLLTVDAALRAFAADGTLRELASTWLTPAFGISPDDVPVIRAR